MGADPAHGVNTLAYRLPQHQTFFMVDADCVPITTAIPLEKTKEWLDLIARSGIALLVSPEPHAIGDEQRQAIKEAFQIVTAGSTGARPRDWQWCTTPADWECPEPKRQPRAQTLRLVFIIGSVAVSGVSDLRAVLVFSPGFR